MELEDLVGQPREETTQFSFRLPRTLLAQVKKEARKRGLSAGSLVKRILVVALSGA